MPYLTPSGGQPLTIPRRSKAATDNFKASRNPTHTTRPAHYLPSSLKPLTPSNPSSHRGSPAAAAGPSGVGSASGRPRSRSAGASTPRPTGSSSSPPAHGAKETRSQSTGQRDQVGLDQITSQLTKTTLGEPSTARPEDPDRRDSTPSLCADAASASSVSVQSLGGVSDNDGETTPATSAGDSHAPEEGAVLMATVSREDRSEAVRRYMQELYAFHRRLYEEAKSDAEGAPRRGSFSQFGERKSGMAKLAAKKALASKLNM